MQTTFEGYTAEQIDFNGLWYYSNMICRLTDWNYDTLYLPEDLLDAGRARGSMIYVFDNDPSTKVVCSGYARALKYLCDLSTFEGDWIRLPAGVRLRGREPHVVHP